MKRRLRAALGITAVERIWGCHTCNGTGFLEWREFEIDGK